MDGSSNEEHAFDPTAWTLGNQKSQGEMKEMRIRVKRKEMEGIGNYSI
jgi:hypothetical protein